MSQQKIAQIFADLYGSLADVPEKLVILAVISAFIEDHHWLMGEEKNIALLRGNALTTSVAFINPDIKTIIVPMEYQESIIQGLQQECVSFFAEKLSVCFFRGDSPVTSVVLKIGPNSLVDLLKIITHHLQKKTSVQFTFTFTKDAVLWLKDEISDARPTFLQLNEKNVNLSPPRSFSQLWDHWYG